MTTLFEGKKIASEIEGDLKEQVNSLKLFGITPKLTSIVVGDNEGAMMYQKMKQKAAERIGAKLEIIAFDENGKFNERHAEFISASYKEFVKTILNQVQDDATQNLIELISELGKDQTIHGIMIQLPLPKSFSKEDIQKIIEAIPSEKDIDGMKADSPFCAPVAHAVMDAISEADPYLKNDEGLVSIAVVGAKGFVGKKIISDLKKHNYEKMLELDLDARLDQDLRGYKIVVSATGVPDLIKGSYIDEGAIAVDVGAPKGDFDESVNDRAAFITPVPGGIGPVTITRLMDNLVQAANNSRK